MLMCLLIYLVTLRGKTVWEIRHEPAQLVCFCGLVFEIARTAVWCKVPGNRVLDKVVAARSIPVLQTVCLEA